MCSLVSLLVSFCERHPYVRAVLKANSCQILPGYQRCSMIRKNFDGPLQSYWVFGVWTVGTVFPFQFPFPPFPIPDSKATGVTSSRRTCVPWWYQASGCGWRISQSSLRTGWVRDQPSMDNPRKASSSKVESPFCGSLKSQDYTLTLYVMENGVG